MERLNNEELDMLINLYQDCCCENHIDFLVQKVSNELKNYRDLEEQGKLIQLPFNIGDTVYTNYFMKGISPKKGDKLFKVKIIFIGIDGVDNFLSVHYEDGCVCKFKFSEIGEKVFLSEEDARLKLEETEEL